MHNDVYKKLKYLYKGNIMWTTPAAVEMRYGFEVTAYIMTR